MCAAGRTAKDAAIVADIYAHTMDVIERATLLGGYAALPATRHLRRRVLGPRAGQAAQSRQAAAVFTGEVALVTGAASGIGKACVDALLARGAAVVGLDIESRHHDAAPARRISSASAAT